jgi:hypothetical protein
MQLRTHPKMEWEGFSNGRRYGRAHYGRADAFPMAEEGADRCRDE